MSAVVILAYVVNIVDIVDVVCKMSKYTLCHIYIACKLVIHNVFILTMSRVFVAYYNLNTL